MQGVPSSEMPGDGCVAKREVMPMSLKCASDEDVLKAIKDNKVQMIDLRFTDLPGTWQHFSVPPSAVDSDAMNEGIGFDGSSIHGLQDIQERDMLVEPDPS